MEGEIGSNEIIILYDDYDDDDLRYIAVTIGRTIISIFFFVVSTTCDIRKTNYKIRFVHSLLKCES